MAQHKQWQPPSKCWQVWTDGSLDEHNQTAGIAAVVRGPEGSIVARKIARKPCASSAQAELLAAELGLQTLRGILGPDGLQAAWILNMDCQSVLASLASGRNKNPLRQQALDRILPICGGMQTQWVPRSQNRDADRCAQRAHRLYPNTSILLPSWIPSAQQQDHLELYNRLRRARRKVLQSQQSRWNRWQRLYAPLR